MRSGQARVPDWSRRLGSSPLSTFAAQGTSALTATHRRDCGRRSRPQTRSTSRTIGPPSAPVCSRPAPCKRTDAWTSRAKGGSGQETVPVAAGSVNRHRLLQFNPSQPPKGGAINARALSSLRITAGAKNPRHNITQHCITPRGSGGSQNRPWRSAWSSPPNCPCACCGLYNVMLC